MDLAHGRQSGGFPPRGRSSRGRSTRTFRVRSLPGTGVLALLGLAACGGAPSPNLLLVTLDTTRADHIGCYGNEAARTPNLDALAARGVVFEDAHSPAPMTLPVHATLLTGLLPPEHGARVNGEHRLADDVPTLAESLREEGYRTGAFVAAFVLDGRFGLERGFDVYDDDLTGAYEQDVPSALARYRPGNVVVDSALAWLEEGEAGAPFFAWVHLYDAHYPWFSHEDGAVAPSPGSGTYEGELAFVDRQVGRLLAWLEERGLEETTLVVALADHGEGLGDHGEIEHAYLLNEEVLHVPWIAAGPGVRPGLRVPSLVTLRDFHPTVSALLGLEGRATGGRSLVPALAGGGVPDGESYAETDLPWSAYRWSPQRSLTTEQWKYVRTPQPELYDRTKDRAELVNLIEVEAERAASLEARLTELEAGLAERRSEAAELSSADLEALADLGYAVGGAGGPEGETSGLADVKERLPAKRLAARLRELQAKDELAPQAFVEMARQLVEMSPETPAFHGHLGQALAQVGQLDEALAELELVTRLVPEDAGAHYDLGDTLQQNGRTAQAREHLEKALDLEPNLAAAHVGLGNVLRDEGRPDLAAGRYTKAIELRDGIYPEAHYNLALTFLDRDQPEPAVEHFRLAAEQRPGWGMAHASLARLYGDLGRPAEALEQYEKALALAPDRPELQLQAGIVLDVLGRVPEAASCYRTALELQPGLYKAHLGLGAHAAGSGRYDQALRHFQEALTLAPRLVEPTARLARFLASCPEDGVRDPEQAVLLAERARDLQGPVPHPRVLDTLGIAYASAKRYRDALGVAREAEQAARSAGDLPLADEIGARLALYAAERAYLDPPVPSTDPGER